MKIKYSALVMGVSGKLNGSVGATNKGGAYLRNKGVVSNPNTPAQAAVRSRFGSLSSSFRSLTPAQISAWNTAAAGFPVIDRLGDTRYLTGLGLFVQLNTNRVNVGLVPLDSPPVKQAFPAVSEVLLAASGSANSLTVSMVLSVAPTAAEFLVVVKMAQEHSPSVTNVKNKLRQLIFSPSVADVEQTIDLYEAYEAAFGSLTTGQVVTAEVFLVSAVSGEASASVIVSDVIV